jgi:hypothetical protein
MAHVDDGLAAAAALAQCLQQQVDLVVRQACRRFIENQRDVPPALAIT